MQTLVSKLGAKKKWIQVQDPYNVADNVYTHTHVHTHAHTSFNPTVCVYNKWTPSVYATVKKLAETINATDTKITEQTCKTIVWNTFK